MQRGFMRNAFEKVQQRERGWLGICAGTLALGAMLFIGNSTPVFAEELTADEIMQRVYDRDDGDNSTSEVQMTLIDKAGDQRSRVLRTFSKDFGADTKQLIYFLGPADVEDIGLLTFDYAGVKLDDDQWLYLPALKKTKRIATSDQSGKFVGTDFSYADLTDRENEEYKYELIGSEEVRGEPVWRIHAVPNEREINRTGYTESYVWVRKDSFVVVRAVHYVREGGRMKYYDVPRLEVVDGIWSPLEIVMTTKAKDKSTEHRTILRVSDLKYNQGYSEDMFSVRQLEKGP